MRPADLPIRLLARFIDVLVVAAIDVALAQVLGTGWIWLIVGSAMVLAYFAMMDVFFGATVGKRVLGLRVLGPQGGRPSGGEAVRRELFTLAGSIPFVGPFLALAVWIWLSITIHKDPQRQGKHDLFAGGTRVVRVR